MKLVTCVYGLAMCYVFLRGATCTKGANEDADDSRERRDDIIQEVGRSLLGVKEMSESDGAQRRTPPTPPRYMLDLYDRYKSGQTPVQGNTVRSILPMRGKLKGVDMLVFNLTGIHAEEQILQGKLHIFRRKQSKRGGGGGGGRKREAVRLKIADLSLKFPPHWVDVPKQKNSGWQSFEVTESVIGCRNAQHEGDYLLGVSSESRRLNGKYKPVPIRRIARLSTQPFLIIFSEDRNNRTVNNTSDQDTVSPSYEEIREMLMSHRNATENHKSAQGSPHLRHKRAVRSTMLLNYLLPTDENYIKSDENFESKNHQNVSAEGRPTNDSKASRRETSVSADENYIHTSDENSEYENRQSVSGEGSHNVSNASGHKIDSTVSAISKDSEEPRQKMRRVKKVNKRKKEKEKKYPRLITEGKCERKDLIVDFSLFGWTDWIVSPPSFNAYYCSGPCRHSIKQVNISNHGVIQSMMHVYKELRKNSEDVPAPCCVPTSTKPLKMVYLDKAGVVMLKEFKEMIVERCECR